MPSSVLVSAGYSVVLATEAAEIRAAQELRYQVFATELGAAINGPGIDVDKFDALCDHLLIRDDATGTCVGTYRMLPPGRSAELYSDGEFHLDRLAALRPELVETGRSCVHPDHRNGAVIGLMWAGIARYLHLSGHGWLAGCASVPLADGGEAAAATASVVNAKYLAPAAHRVEPRNPWVGPVGAPARLSLVPPLLRGYLRLGARVCGPPAHDPAFGTADFFVLLSLADTDPRYLRRFLGEP
ncbi:GNAT family N-acetyltransferase [Cryptosporangium sp. NPDC048952]|uniref:GNAT family N-acetyltransferase n=1 Tax=Cryptosporangium sp. NPDC048952 TaxID=3363961 RepID=UPI00370FFE1D